jgi:hypothetical protein
MGAVGTTGAGCGTGVPAGEADGRADESSGGAGVLLAEGANEGASALTGLAPPAGVLAPVMLGSTTISGAGATGNR